MPRSDALALQEELGQARAEERIPDVVLLAEHEPGIGYGWGTPLPRDHEGPWEDRGGGAALYGPGMLTGYLLLDTEEEHWGMYYLARRVGRVLGRVLGEHLLEVDRVAGLPPAQIRGRRVATVGLGLRGSVTRFGFNLGVDAELDELGASLPEVLGREPRTTMAAEQPPCPVVLEDVATSVLVHLGSALRRRFERVELAELCARAGLPFIGGRSTEEGVLQGGRLDHGTHALDGVDTCLDEVEPGGQDVGR
jgi:lipoate-protein ligase B